MIKRPNLNRQIQQALKRSRAVALIGPRQCGKTTMARELVSADSPNYFDLEDPQSLARLDEPMTALRPLRGVVVIDEVQRRPDLFPILRVLVDRKPLPARFLILGSTSSDFLRQSAESLAGRIETIEMRGFCLEEIGWNAAEPARSLGVTEPTVRRYLDILSGVFMIRQLSSWHANLKKRQVKAPKVYLRDTGLLHHLLGIRSEKELLMHPKG